MLKAGFVPDVPKKSVLFWKSGTPVTSNALNIAVLEVRTVIAALPEVRALIVAVPVTVAGPEILRLVPERLCAKE